jgi:N-formylglutamate deformylase
MRKLILHIPHSSTLIPLKNGYCVSEEILGQEILKLTDWYTEDLFENETDINITAPFSRIFCDTERFSDDNQEIMAKYGMGVLYEKTDTGEPLRNLTPELRKHILDNYYWKHHNRLTESVNLQLEKFGRATIVDCHSFPHQPLNRALDQSPNRPDFNIGTDPLHTPAKYIEVSIKYFESKGFTLGVDQPYSGAIVPLQYYKKDKKVQSIMLEINRKGYLNEPANEKSIRYPDIKQIVQEYLNTIRNL